MSTMLKVLLLGQTYTRDGVAYGPFQATPDRPYLEVPAGIALASGAPLYDGTDAPAQAEAEAGEGEGIHVDEILKANESLKADLDNSRADLDELRHAVGWAPDATVSPADLARNLRGAADTNRDLLEEATVRAQKLEGDLRDIRNVVDRANADRDEAQRELAVARAERDAALAQADTQASAVPGPVTLPIDLRARIAALKNVSEAKADEIMDLLHEVLNPAPAAAPEADAQ